MHTNEQNRVRPFIASEFKTQTHAEIIHWLALMTNNCKDSLEN